MSGVSSMERPGADTVTPQLSNEQVTAFVRLILRSEEDHDNFLDDLAEMLPDPGDGKGKLESLFFAILTTFRDRIADADFGAVCIYLIGHARIRGEFMDVLHRARCDLE